MRPLLPFALLAFAACGPAPEPAKTLEQLAAEKCPKIHLDRLAGDWIVLTGDPKTRVRIVEKDGHYEAYYTGLYVSRLAFTGTRREADIQFDEVPTGRRKERIASGAEQAKRFYAEPSMRTCTLRIFPGMVDASGKEAIAPKPTEFTLEPSSAIMTPMPVVGFPMAMLKLSPTVEHTTWPSTS